MARIGSKKLIGEFLKRHVGEVVTSKQIQDVVPGVAEWARRVRDLREEGWNISSHKDRTDLKPGEYVLEAEPPKPGESGYKFPRKMSDRLRSQVLERNGYTCQMCGIGVGDLAEDGRKATLHVGHIIDRDHGGKDELSNLRVMCSRCNQGAKNLVQEPPSYAWLLGQVRRAKESDQRAVYEWLGRKFASGKP